MARESRLRNLVASLFQWSVYTRFADIVASHVQHYRRARQKHEKETSQSVAQIFYY